MSPSETRQFSWNATSWLLLLLCLSLLGWRYNTRLEQYRLSASRSSVTISIFDANERNYIQAHGTGARPLSVAEAQDRLYVAVESPAQVVRPIRRGLPDARLKPGLTLAHTVSLFSNPPPPSIA
jgi:hypothetical protein